MRLTHRRLLGLAVVAVALFAGSASSTSLAAKCEEGPVKVNGVWWVQYCGPATATAKFSGKTVRFTSGHCIRRKGAGGQFVRILHLGRYSMVSVSPKTKYWELTSVMKGDGVYRNGVFVEWWLGARHYILGDIKMTYKKKQTQGTYTGTIFAGGKGKASGTFKC